MTTPVREKQEQSARTTTKRLAGKVALVTGGSRGIGAAIALRLADEGATVAISYASNKSAADEVVAKINELGTTGRAFKADVTTSADCRNLIDSIAKTVGKIDILINNAGVFEVVPLENIDLDHFDRLYNVNVKGVVATTVAALPLIPNGGRIINVSSIAAETMAPGFSIYCSTKAALNTLTRTWAQELGPKGITVNGVAPGTTATDMLNKNTTDAEQKFYIDKTALGRIGEPDDIASVVAFLASDDARWVTGQTIRTDGGMSV